MTDELRKHRAKQETEENSLTESLKPLIPVVKDFLKNASEDRQAQLEVQRMQMEITKKRLEFEEKKLVASEKERQYTNQIDHRAMDLEIKEHDFSKERFAKYYWLGLIVVCFILLVSAGLIFLEKNVQAGVLLLSHLVAIAVGLLGGAALKKKKPDESDQE